MDDDHIIFTGLGYEGRNLVNIKTSDICLFIKGSIGTLKLRLIDADRIGHYVLKHDDIIDIITKEFPDAIFRGKVSRKQY